jgi:hypothetical protein
MFIVAGMLILVFYGIWYFFPWRGANPLTVERVKMKYKDDNRARFLSADDKINKKGNPLEIARQYHANRIEKEYSDSVLDQLPKSCPDEFRADPAKGIITFSVKDCPKGERIAIHPFRKFVTEQYEVTAFAEAPNKKAFVQLAIPPVIEVLRIKYPDGSKVERLSPPGEVSPIRYRLFGEAAYITDGLAHFVEIKRVP